MNIPELRATGPRQAVPARSDTGPRPAGHDHFELLIDGLAAPETSPEGPDMAQEAAEPAAPSPAAVGPVPAVDQAAVQGAALAPPAPPSPDAPPAAEAGVEAPPATAPAGGAADVAPSPVTANAGKLPVAPAPAGVAAGVAPPAVIAGMHPAAAEPQPAAASPDVPPPPSGREASRETAARSTAPLPTDLRGSPDRATAVPDTASTAVPSAAAPAAGATESFVRDGAGALWQLAPGPAAPGVREAVPGPTAPPPHPPEGPKPIRVTIEKRADDRVRIRLDPPELGRVEIRLVPSDAGLHAVVLAQRPETQELLRRHAEVLLLELADAGYGTVSLDFAAGGDAAPRHDDDAAGERYGLAAAAPAGPVPPPTRRPIAGGLDIRL